MLLNYQYLFEEGSNLTVAVLTVSQLVAVKVVAAKVQVKWEHTLVSEAAELDSLQYLDIESLKLTTG